jgi:hypothetical protein
MSAPAKRITVASHSFYRIPWLFYFQLQRKKKRNRNPPKTTRATKNEKKGKIKGKRIAVLVQEGLYEMELRARARAGNQSISREIYEGRGWSLRRKVCRPLPLPMLLKEEEFLFFSRLAASPGHCLLVICGPCYEIR